MTISSYLQPKTFSASTITLATITAIGLAGCGGSSTPTAQQSNNTAAARHCHRNNFLYSTGSCGNDHTG
jgi:hypothetical protein